MKLIAALLFIPSCFIAGPAVMYIDWKYGRCNPSARKAHKLAAKSCMIMQPYLWAHRTLFCNGDISTQKW